MECSRHVGHLSIQISGQNMKVVRPDGQIIQGPQLIQGPLDYCKVRLRQAAGPTTAGFQFRSTLHSGFPSRPLPSFASRVFKTCVTLVTKADSVYYRYKMGFPEIWVTRGLCYFLPSLSPKPTGRSTRMSPSFPRTPRIISSSEACHLRYTMS